MNEVTEKLLRDLENLPFPLTIVYWFEEDYVVEHNTKTGQAILFEFEPCTEHYKFIKEYEKFKEEFGNTNAITFNGKRYTLIDVDVYQGRD